MTALAALQHLLEAFAIRGKGRLADLLLARSAKEVECHPLPGLTISLRTTQRIERWMWAGAYEPELVTLLKSILKPGMTVLDVGANIGYFSAIAAALVGEQGSVHAFEPLPQNLIRLQKNLEPFRWATLHPFAVAKVTGEATLHYNETEAGWASIHPDHTHENLPSVLKVDVIRLDDWLNENRITRLDFVKLDVEGSELDALLGGGKTLFAFRPTIIAETKNNWHWQEICDLLGKQGYNCTRFSEDCMLAIPNPLPGSAGLSSSPCTYPLEIFD